MSDISRELFLAANLTRPALTNGDHVHLTLRVPFYFAMRQNLFDTIPDNVLALAAPIVAYWTLSLFFYLLDASGWTWLDPYRIHESNEVKSRNRATPFQVFCAVTLQHTFQTFLGYYWLSDAPQISPSRSTMEMEAVGRTLLCLIRWTVGPDVADPLWALRGVDVTHWLYWWIIPAAQLFFSMQVLFPQMTDALIIPKQVHHRHMGIFCSPLDAFKQVLLQDPFHAPSVICTLRVWRIVQSPRGGFCA